MRSVEQFLTEAEQYMEEGRLGEAYIVYRNLLETYPDYEDKMSILADIGYLSTSDEVKELEKQMSGRGSTDAIECAKKVHEEQERKAIQAEERRKNMIISTCSNVDGYTSEKQYGIVFGECVFKTGLLKSLGATLENIGNILTPGDRELSGSMRILENARAYAIEKMKTEAWERGANAILGVDAESSLGGDIMHITVYGTAVYLKKQDDIQKSDNSF